jgi:hypothetical protein
MSIIPVTVLCLSLSGGAAFALPVFDIKIDVGLQKWLDVKTAMLGAMEKNNALAVARDGDRWSNEGAYGVDTVEEARTMALDACNYSALSRGIKAPCKIYAVNGVRVVN